MAQWKYDLQWINLQQFLLTAEIDEIFCPNFTYLHKQLFDVLQK